MPNGAYVLAEGWIKKGICIVTCTCKSYLSLSGWKIIFTCGEAMQVYKSSFFFFFSNLPKMSLGSKITIEDTIVGVLDHDSDHM